MTTLPFTIEELEDAYIKLEDGITKALELTGTRFQGGKWMSFDGTPCPGADVMDMLRNEIVKSHELIRTRQHISISGLSDEARFRLVELLNLVARFINVVTAVQGTDIRLDDIAQRIEDNLYYFVASQSSDRR